MIKTSIIVPVYNTASFLKDCFDSIFNQTQKEIEVIAINDGSTDNSLAILEAIKEEHPELIIFSQENQGQGAARNKGMELATGEFIYFIDSDDCMVSDAMETCYHCAKMNDVDIVMFDADIFGETEGISNNYDRTEVIKEQFVIMKGKEYAKKYWLRSFCPSPCLIYTSANFLKKYNFRFIPRIYYEDNEFLCKIIPSAKVIYLPRMLYKRRYRKGSTMLSPFDLSHAKDYLKMIQLVRKQKHSEGIENIISEMQRRWVASLLQLCIRNNLLDDSKFVEDFYQTARKIYGNSMKKINQYRDINVLCQLSDSLGVEIISDEARKEIEDRRKELLDIFCEKNPLAKAGGCVGIYGTGKKTEEFLSEYRETIGEIESNICFVESDVKSGEKKYMDFDVLNIDDIGEIQLDCIIITSVKYEQQMRENIRERYGDAFKVLLLKANMQLEEC